ncbi:MAG: DUF1080 domain-containing protein [Planctomycetota bacterium]
MSLAVTLLLLAQTPSNDVSNQFELLDGMAASLWAESPLMYNPTAMAFDAQGRLWVTEAVNYRQWDGRNPGKHFPQGDRVVVLEDTNGDGKADTSTVFVQDIELTSPLGICVLEDRVLVSCSPNLYEYRDTDGDLKADTRTTLLTGFGGHDHDHGLHSFVAMPDGDLLFAVGNAGPHMVTDKDGFQLRSGSSYRGGGQFPADNHPGLVSDDGRIWTGGLIGRMHPDGSGLQIIAHNFRNDYEAAVDSYGDVFVSDNDDDGNRSCRTVSIVEGGNYGYFSADGSRFWGADRRPGQATLSAHWHQMDPGVMPLGTANGAGGPTGVTVYEEHAFPQLFGTILNADAGRSLVFTHRPSIQGAALELEEGILIQPAYEVTGDRGHWFRPSDVAVAPDGSIYVADWFDPGVGGHQAGDAEAYGRIIRIHNASTATASPLAASLEANRAKQLWKKSASDFPLELLKESLHESERFRVAAYRAWTRVHGFSIEAAELFRNDPSPYVRARVAASMRDAEGTKVEQLWLDFALLGPLDDRVYLECLGLGADGKEDSLFTQILAADTEDATRLPLLWRLHPPASLKWLVSFCKEQRHPMPLRLRAIDAIAFMPQREAAEAMLLLALDGAEELRGRAGYWVRHRRENDWRSFDLGDALAGNFDRAELSWQSEVMRDATTTSIDLPLERAEIIWLVVDDAGDGNSCDWGDWLDLRFEGADGIQSVNASTWIEAEAGWGSVHKNADCVGGALDVGGVRFDTGIGTHAPSRIGIQVPSGATRLLGACAADDNGTSQNNATSIRFSIHMEQKRDAIAIAQRERAAIQGDVAAAKILAQNTAGALFLLQKAKAKQLPTTVLEAIAPLLKQHTDLSIRALASEVFTTESHYPPADTLAAMPGDAFRGQELFRGRGTCFACHTYNGLGGSLGPELSVIGEKFGRRGLIDALLAPSASIAFGFDTWIFTLQDGRHITGAILADGERIVLRDSAGTRQVFSASEVVAREHQATSSMPPAQSMGLSSQDLADLVSFLTQQQNPQPEFGDAISLFNGKDLQGWKFQLPEGTDPTSVWSVKNGVLRCEGNPIGYLYTDQDYTDFEIELDWRGDPATGPGNSGVLLRVQEPHQVWPRSIEAQLHSGNAGDIWNIDHFPLLVDAARTSGRHTVKMQPSNERPLGEWNHYRIRVFGSRVTLEVNGTIQNTADWAAHLAGPIALQSEGAVMEFKNIVLRPIRN